MSRSEFVNLKVNIFAMYLWDGEISSHGHEAGLKADQSKSDGVLELPWFHLHLSEKETSCICGVLTLLAPIASGSVPSPKII